MSNTIPPLLCSTPPPIDFDDGNEHDDDFGAFESADSEYGQFDGPSLPTTPKNTMKSVDLPVPNFSPFQIKNITKQVPVASTKDVAKQDSLELEVTIEDCIEPEIQTQITNHIENSELTIDLAANAKVSSIKDRIEYTSIIDEPPAIDIGYSCESESTKNSRRESPQSLEFNPEILSDDDSIGEFQVNETKYDDNTSLPSLKFDAIDIAKSETPVVEDKSILNKILVSEELAIAEKFSTTSAFEAEKLAEQEDVASEYIYQSQERNLAEGDNIKLENLESSGKEILQTVPVSSLKSSDKDLTVEDFIDHRDEISKSDSSEMMSDNCLPIDNLNCICEEIAKSESPSELEPDDDFNCDFQEFEGFSGTLNSKDEPPPFTIDNDTNDIGEIIFEADFSQIVPAMAESIAVSRNIIEKTQIEENIDRLKRSESSEQGLEDSFDGFQDFATQPGNENTDDGDDDDFGDFNDFQETSSSYQTSPILNITKIDDKLKSVLKMMFPNEESIGRNDDKNSPKELNNNLTSDLREIDSAKALEYQWTSSSMKHSLIKALGIDSRNILYGEKWNSSMPRYAANLGFNPLEPLKPKLMSSADTTNFSETFSSRSTGSDVPAVKFDWNSSGLVNPLDGVKEILHEGKTEKIYPTKFNDTDESSEPTSSEKSSASSVEPPKFITPLSDVNNDLKDETQIEETIVANNIESYAHTVELDGNHLRPSSSNTFVVPLKETHIYTPSKSENSVSRSVKTGENCSIDFDYQMAAAGIVINEKVVKKEYRDIVYNPEAQMVIPSQLGSIIAPDSENVAVVDPNKNFRHKSPSEVFSESMSVQTLNIIENVASTTKTIEDLTDDFSDFQQNNNTTVQQFTSSVPIGDFPLADKCSSVQNIEIESKCDIKPIQEILLNATSFDDEFSDFQSVPPPAILSKPIKDLKPKSRTETPTISDEMILSPAILLPQAIKIENTEPQINWPGDPSINPDELARLEQLFPQVRSVQSSPMNNPSKSNATVIVKEDDDWSDFVSVPANTNSTNQMLQSPTRTTKLSTISKTYDDDDWSEFVSSTPAPATIVNKLAWNTASMPPPQFNSWNQPNFHVTLPTASQQQGLYLTSHQQFQQANNTTMAQKLPAANLHQTNHFLMNGHLNQAGSQLKNQNVLSQQQQQQLQYQEQQRRSQTVLRSQLNLSPSISLIPDLGFIAPKSIINVPRTNFSKK